MNHQIEYFGSWYSSKVITPLSIIESMDEWNAGFKTIIWDMNCYNWQFPI